MYKKIKNKIIYILGCLFFLGFSCQSDAEKQISEKLYGKSSSSSNTEASLDVLLTFEDWIYIPGSPARLKYKIVKNSAEIKKVNIEASMVLYNASGEAIGNDRFVKEMTDNIIIDYHDLATDLKETITRVVLKDIFLNDQNYRSVEKRFDVKKQ